METNYVFKATQMATYIEKKTFTFCFNERKPPHNVNAYKHEYDDYVQT